MATDLEEKIIRQIEYYFGDINLPRDKFLQEKVKEDDGWVTLEVLLTFKRLASLSPDQEAIAKAVEKSDSGLCEVSEDKKKIRRNPDLPLPELNDARRKELSERTAYAKGFPLEEELTEIVSFFEAHGPIESCNRRSTKDHKFKGSCFIIFKTKDDCKKFIETEGVKYKESDLLRKWQADYFVEKKKQYEERIKSKKEKKQAKLDEKTNRVHIEYPKGAVVYFTGIPEGKSITREEIKESAEKVNDKHAIAFIDFQKGDLEGHLRFAEEDGGVEFVRALPEGAEVAVGEVRLKLRSLAGEEEEAYLKKTVEVVAKLREKNRMNRKRKGGNFHNNGRQSKKRSN